MAVFSVYLQCFFLFKYVLLLHFYIVCLSVYRPDVIAEGVLALIKDQDAVGKVMTVTKAKGHKYIRLLGDPKPKL